MTIELTKTEYSRLQKHMMATEKQRRNNPQEISSLTEMEIAKLSGYSPEYVGESRWKDSKKWY